MTLGYGYRWKSVTLSAKPQVTAGSTYAIVFEAPSGYYYVYRYRYYSGGKYWYRYGTGSWYSSSYYDIAFKTYVEVSAYASSGYARSVDINPGGVQAWGELTFSDSEPAGTDVKYSVYGYNGSWVLLMSNLDSSPVSLSSIDPSAYTRLRVRADLSTSNTAVTPTVDWWKVTYYK